MSKKDKESPNGSPADQDQEKDGLFDFDKTFGESFNENEAQDNSELNATIAELKDKYLRLLADFDNYKKRTNRERLDLLNSASKDVIISLLPILDDFDRAKKSAEEGSQGEHWSDGVNLVYNRLYNTLQLLGLKPMESNGESFDPDLHEAITEIPAPDQPGKVIDTVEKGYTLNDKIIRHARVVVGK
ncbi:MAG: nucleotide exchange factor GrpE [Bacteroidota bacterium]|nr:nucleotide exchange factor GrpE [Bacteroidota bacterium]